MQRLCRSNSFYRLSGSAFPSLFVLGQGLSLVPLNLSDQATRGSRAWVFLGWDESGFKDISSELSNGQGQEWFQGE